MLMRAMDRRQDNHVGGYDPERMSTDERLDEVAGLLAMGLLRMRRRAGEKRRVSRGFNLAGCARKRPHGAKRMGGR